MDANETITQRELMSFVKDQAALASTKKALLDRLTKGAAVEPGVFKATVSLGAAQSTSWKDLATSLGATPAQVADHTTPVEQRSQSLSVGIAR
jgi:hypothetical protein